MSQQIDEILEALRTFGLPIFEDEIAEDEQEQFKEDGHNFFIYTTGDMSKNDDKKSILQDVAVIYYSENKENLDEQTVDIIEALKDVGLLTFNGAQKERLRRKDTDGFVDRIIFLYQRKIILPGCII